MEQQASGSGFKRAFAEEAHSTSCINTGDFPVFSCANNPLDLRPAIDLLEDTIRKRLLTEKPLVILIGKTHLHPTQVGLPQFIAERFLNRPNPPRIAMGIERPCDLHEHMLEEKYGNRLTQLQRTERALKDTEGQEMLTLYRETQMVPGAPVTRRNMLEFFRRNNLSVRAVDAPLADDHDGQGGTSIHGMKRRNHTAANHVEAHMRESGAELYILPYGGAHLFGMQEQKPVGEGDDGILPYPFSQSLYTELSSKNINVFPLLMSNSRLNPATIDPEGLPFLKQGLVIKDLDQTSFWLNLENTPEVNEDIRRREALFLSEINRQSGNVLTIYPDEGVTTPYSNPALHI